MEGDSSCRDLCKEKLTGCLPKPSTGGIYLGQYTMVLALRNWLKKTDSLLACSGDIDVKAKMTDFKFMADH